jgi:hypothetical protein
LSTGSTPSLIIAPANGTWLGRPASRASTQERRPERPLDQRATLDAVALEVVSGSSSENSASGSGWDRSQPAGALAQTALGRARAARL